ncbi:hypothetical protein SAMN05216463_11854 [Xylanibacter ruminicola]|uniref:Uncharacterized protein n=1 Tax=Xylanibacter ruminicola TaxID=839 RepID=A0A1M6WXG0_XYLRU|nr:hypothetical protein SAMN05216463_11854 [Xylanibacter ruminicola]
MYNSPFLLGLLYTFVVLENFGKTSERFWKNLGKFRKASENFG